MGYTTAQTGEYPRDSTATANSTGEVEEDIARGLWVGFVVVESVMLLGSLYLFASLVFHIISRRRRLLGQTRSPSRRIYNGVLLLLVAAYTAASTGKFILAQVMFYSDVTGETCADFAKANRFLHLTGFALLSLFLWFRQHVLYETPQLRHLTAPGVKWWSRITLALIAIAFVSGYVIIGMKKWSHDNLCVTSDSGLSPSALSGVISAVVVQGSLLTLFALLVIKRWYWRGELPVVIHAGQYKRTRHLVTKCCILAALCAFTDISCLVIVTSIKTLVPELVTILILDLDQFFNLSCLVLCFATWRKLLLPWPCCGSCDLADTTSTPSTSGGDTASVARGVRGTSHYRKRGSTVSIHTEVADWKNKSENNKENAK